MAKRVVAEFDRYMAHLGEALGYSTRNQHLTEYCGGLMLPLKRKSVEPLAAEADPRDVPAKHQALLHFVANAPWADRAVLDRVHGYLEPHLDFEQGTFWMVDDTGHRKYGSHSVGVAHQYCGNLGKDDNCQVAVSLSLASARGSVPIDYGLYLPKSWAFDRKRRRKAGVPEEVVFQTKPEIALAQIRAAQARGVRSGVVVADAAYGSDTVWREGLSELGLPYAVGVLSSVTVWPPGVKPLPPARYRGRGRVPTKLRRGPGHEPMSVKQLALRLKDLAWRTLTWREGTNKTLTSRFACVRVRAAHRDYQRSTMRAEEWLLIEWPRAEAEPIKYWLSSLPADTPLERLVDTAKMRWRIEHDYHELKQEFGLSHYEGRGWRGFHHHATLCIAAYGFLTAQRLQEGTKKNHSTRPKTPSLSQDHQSRASRPSAAPRARLDSNAAISNCL
jgi:SRSO17 transposase